MRRPLHFRANKGSVSSIPLGPERSPLWYRNPPTAFFKLAAS
jgi:hypothetical protein